MENLENNQINCKYCNDEGYIYTCLNCFKPAIYDSEFGFIVCDACFLLGDKQNTISEKCTHCNIADIVIDIPKVGDVHEFPDAEKINQIINWRFNLKIMNGDTYDLITPIKIENNKLKYFSNVENIIKFSLISNLMKVIVALRTPTTVSWTTTLNGLIQYLKEDRNSELIQNCNFVKLLSSNGCSWDLKNLNPNDIINKTNIKESHFVNGVTFNINDLLKESHLGFKELRISNPDVYYINKSNNLLYLIESIRKFELF